MSNTNYMTKQNHDEDVEYYPAPCEICECKMEFHATNSHGDYTHICDQCFEKEDEKSSDDDSSEDDESDPDRSSRASRTRRTALGFVHLDPVAQPGR
eukprot:SAG22_NODE_502_length_9704_cov_23.436439_7_plen_97_part_00